MEFAEGLKKASELGLSKEEFMVIWNKEMDLRILNHSVDSHKNCSKEECLASEIQDLKVVSQELKLELVNMRNEMFNQNQDLLSAIKQIVSQQQNQEIGALLKSVLDIAMEAKTLRTYMEDLTKKVNNLSVELKSEIAEMKQKVVSLGVPNSSTNTSDASSTGSHSDIVSNWTEEKRPKVNENNNHVTATSTSKGLKVNRNEQLPDFSLDTKQYPWKLTKSYTKSYQNKTFFNYPKVKETEQKVETNTNVIVAVPLNRSTFEAPQATSLISLENSASGLAEISQTAEIVTSTLVPIDYGDGERNQIVNNSDNDVHAPKKDLQNNGAVKNSTVLSTSKVFADRGVRFTIPETHGFYKAKEEFFTDYYPLKKVPCKVRMKLRLDKDEKILVSALVSFLNNSEAILPLSFEGNGYISAKLSGGRGHSKIWTIHHTLKQKPKQDTEVCIDAQVCLQTNRNTYTRITYSKLVNMGYDEAQRLEFLWDLVSYPVLPHQSSLLK
uniref:Uncharacterized protein n=1 Tax=Biomphalaria glabrata TaxID=6526 RepID=A0A2C9KRG8_BIOGL